MLNLDESSMKVIILGKLFTILSIMGMGLNSTKPRDFFYFSSILFYDRR